MNPGTPSLLRGINDRAALDLLLEHGPLSRTQLGELTGLSKPTAAQLLTRLADAGLVITSGNTRGGPGPRAQLYAVNPDAAYVAALDVTPTRILAAVADITGRTIGDYELRTPRKAGTDAVRHVLHALDGAAASAGINRAPAAPARHRHAGRLRPGEPAAPLRPAPARLARPAPARPAHRGGRHAAGGRQRREPRRDRRDALGAGPRGAGLRPPVGGRRAWARPSSSTAASTGAPPAVPGRSASCRSPAPRWSATYDAATPAASRSWPAAARCWPWPARSGCAPSTPQAAVAKALTTPGPGDELLATLAERFALGIAAVVSVVDPSLVVLAGGVLTAGGTRLRDQIADEVGSLALTRPRLELAGVTENPVLAGALQTALAATRNEVFDTIQRRTVDSSARPVTRREP